MTALRGKRKSTGEVGEGAAPRSAARIDLLTRRPGVGGVLTCEDGLRSSPRKGLMGRGKDPHGRDNHSEQRDDLAESQQRRNQEDQPLLPGRARDDDRKFREPGASDHGADGSEKCRDYRAQFANSVKGSTDQPERTE